MPGLLLLGILLGLFHFEIFFFYHVVGSQAVAEVLWLIKTYNDVMIAGV